MNKLQFSNGVLVEVFHVDKNNQKVVARSSSFMEEGFALETIALSDGDNYILVPGCEEGDVQSVVSGNKWIAKNGNKYDPHGCLPKGIFFSSN